MSRIRRHPSWSLCRQLAGAAPFGNVGDLADMVAMALECAESEPRDLPPDPPTLADAHRAIMKIRATLERAEKRIVELGRVEPAPDTLRTGAPVE